MLWYSRGAAKKLQSSLVLVEVNSRVAAMVDQLQRPLWL